MVGRLSDNALRIMRSTEVRFIGLTVGRKTLTCPFRESQPAARKAWLYLVQSGPACLRIRRESTRDILLQEGDLVGIEGGWHEWIGPDTATPRKPVELLYSSVDLKSAVLRQLADGVILIRKDDQPYASTIRQCLELMETDALECPQEDGVRRRLAEACMIQMVRFARERILRKDFLGSGADFDPHILNALAAFFADPGQAWTVTSLAAAAGLGRANLFEKFQTVFGRSPMKMINRLRLQIASERLRTESGTLEEVANAVGYGSAAAFVRAFQREFGATPGKWRQLPR